MNIELKQAAEKALIVLESATSFMSRKARDQHASVVAELRTAIQQAESEPALPDGYVVAPHFRGYARLGIGAYLINHSAPGHEPELVISVATEDEKAGRSVGEERDNAPGSEIQPEQIAVRLCFEDVAGLDALEKQLRYLREAHFSDAHPAPGVPDGHVLVPIERSYDQRVKALIAFNRAEKDGKDRDDALQAAWDASLTAAQAQEGGKCLPIHGNQVTCSRGTGGCGIQHKGGD